MAVMALVYLAGPAGAERVFDPTFALLRRKKTEFWPGERAFRMLEDTANTFDRGEGRGKTAVVVTQAPAFLHGVKLAPGFARRVGYHRGMTAKSAGVSGFVPDIDREGGVNAVSICEEDGN